MQLSKHFTLKEMTKSMTATRKGIDNTPGAGEIKSLGDESGANRKQVLTFDGKKYTEGLPEMKWSGGKVVN